MRLSLGLARVSPTGTQATLNEQNVEEEVNGDTESGKKTTETTEPVQNKLEETTENETENTTDINDKSKSLRGRKRKNESTKDEQIVEESKENTDIEKDTEESKVSEDNADMSITKDEVENIDSKLDAPPSPKIPRTSARRRSKPPISFKKTKVKTKTNTEDRKPDNNANMNVESDPGKLQDETLDNETDEIQPVIKEELNESVINDTKEDITEVTSSMDSDKDILKDEKLIHDSVSKIKSEDVSLDALNTTNNISTSTPRTSQKSVRANRNNSPAAVLMKKTKVVPDLTNPIYLKPFQYGWKRELVYRATTDSSMKKQGDVYYYTPAGKKVRSMREVAENLRHKELNLDDFTFFKEPLGINDTEKEIIRDARIKGTNTPVGGGGSSIKKKPKPKKQLKTSLDNSSESPVTSNTKVAKTPKTTSPQIKVKVPGRLGHGGRVNSSKPERKRNTGIADMEIGLLPPGWDAHPKKNTKQSKLSEGFGPAEQCSVNCPRIMGTIPTTQCQHCLCLFHPECVVVAPNAPLKQSVFCQNCYQSGDSKTTQDNMPDSNSTVCLPPLTPINAIKSHAPVLSQPPKLQRIPRQDKMFAPPSVSHRSLNTSQSKIKNDESVKMGRGGRLETIPRFVKISDQRSGGSITPTDSSKNLVGSVTTWLPPNSTLQMAPGNDSFNSTAGERSPPPVSQAIIEGKNYIVVRKHNILSIHPNEQASTAPILDKSLPLSETNLESHGSVTSFLDKIPATASLGPSLTDTITSTQSNINSQSKTSRSFTESSLVSSETNTQNVNNEHLVEQTTPDSLIPPLPEPINLPPIPEKILNGDADRDPTSVNIITESQASPEKTVKSKRNLQKQITNAAAVVQPDQTEKMKFAQYFFTNLSIGYDALLQVFQYLKVQELLRAGMVCRMWRDLASKPSLWRTVRMKNSQVCDWDGLVASLNRYGTHTLDLRKMLIPGNGDEMWTQFSSAISKATSLTRIYLCRCPAVVVEELACTNSNLEVINAVTIKCEVINPALFENLKDLQELRLKSQNGISFKEDMTALKNLTNLKHLSLVSIKVLGLQGVEVIGALENLESLELGECTDFADNFGTTVLSGLKKLEKLRFEKGPTSSSCTYDILATVSKLPKVEQLELVNFDVKAGFDKAIAACVNIKRFLIIPTYISQSATTNHMVLNGVVQLNNTLSHFVWGVTLELLRVTELFVDQCDKNPKKESSPKKDKKCLNAESIPVLKPVPFMISGREDAVLSEDSSAKDNPQVEILPLANLQKLLCEKLPKTRVKILKIPFHATWRQSIHDSIQ